LFASEVGAGATALTWPRPVRFGVAELAEAIARGQVVERYRLEAWVDGAWVTCAAGTTIGHKRLERFAPVTTTRVRLVVESTLSRPRVSLRLYEG
jgi:alpha-L-fucosidase